VLIGVWPVACGVSANGGYSGLQRALKALAAGICIFAMPACSITMPFETKSAAILGDDELTTASIPQKKQPDATQPGQVSPLSPKLDLEDTRRAQAALATALDPQGNGATVRWDNPDSGAKGSFGAVGNAFLINHTICRMFVATVSVKEPEQWLQGNACRVTAGEWTIKDVKAWKKPG
jgi:surface antigen